MISIYNYTLFEETSGQYSFESQDIEMETWGSRFGRYGCFQCYFHISPFSFLPFFSKCTLTTNYGQSSLLCNRNTKVIKISLDSCGSSKLIKVIILMIFYFFDSNFKI